MFEFLTLPERTAKPRSSGLTYVVDGGRSLEEVRQSLSMTQGLVDIVKLGWGTGIVTPNLREKVELYRSYGVPVCFGGTLFELCLWQNKLEEYLNVVRDLGMEYLEISDSTVSMGQAKKLALLGRLSSELRVMSVVGSKHTSVVIRPDVWADSVKRELDAGVWKVVTEGRDPGPGSIYELDGHVREDVLDAITLAVGANDLLFEAPVRSKQAWFIKRFGANVNLGNVPPDEVVPLETLRLGARSDTLLHFH